MSVKIYMYEGELKSGFGADRMQKFSATCGIAPFANASKRGTCPRP